MSKTVSLVLEKDSRASLEYITTSEPAMVAPDLAEASGSLGSQIDLSGYWHVGLLLILSGDGFLDLIFSSVQESLAACKPFQKRSIRD